MSKITVRFAFETETKNKFRFAEVDESGTVLEQAKATVGTLYVSKTAFGGKAPATLEIEIDGGSDGKSKPKAVKADKNAAGATA